MDNKKLGQLGEDLAAKYLKNKGYKILDRNFAHRLSSGKLLAEIDLVTKKDQNIHFVEVKTQQIGSCSQNLSFPPQQRIDSEKKTKMAQIGEIWLQQNDFSLTQAWALDVIAVRVNPAKPAQSEIKHFENIRLS